MKFGIIAGEGSFPHLAAKQISEKGGEIYAAALDGYASNEIERYSEAVLWAKIGQLKKTINFFRKNGVDEIILAGRVRHASLYSIKPDLLAVKLLAGVKDKRAATVLKAVCRLFEENGIRILSSIEPVKNLAFEEKIYTRRKPSAKQKKDIEFARKIASRLSGLDIGQTVIVKDGAVVAVEAMEGTDECILRAGKIAGSGCVIVKLARPDQDIRFDVPVIGLRTVKKAAEAGAAVIAAQKDYTLFFDREEALEEADRAGIAVEGIAAGERGVND